MAAKDRELGAGSACPRCPRRMLAVPHHGEGMRGAPPIGFCPGVLPSPDSARASPIRTLPPIFPGGGCCPGAAGLNSAPNSPGQGCCCAGHPGADTAPGTPMPRANPVPASEPCWAVLGEIATEFGAGLVFCLVTAHSFRRNHLAQGKLQPFSCSCHG